MNLEYYGLSELATNKITILSGHKRMRYTLKISHSTQIDDNDFCTKQDNDGYQATVLS